tara:strand:+ start:793 stop:999 length:207 start_codon:yes stop_codon:yes gene_type:complete
MTKLKDVSGDQIEKASSLQMKAFKEGDHHLEKLQFALAISESEGDIDRSNVLRSKIKALGGNLQEPGT